MFGISWDVTKINKMEEYYALTRHDRHNLTLQFEGSKLLPCPCFFFLFRMMFVDVFYKTRFNFFFFKLQCSYLIKREKSYTRSQSIIKYIFDMYIYYA